MLNFPQCLPDTIIEQGTHFIIELRDGTKAEVIHWITWHSPKRFHQSYALISSDGPVLIDPWPPVESARERFQALCFLCDQII